MAISVNEFVRDLRKNVLMVVDLNNHVSNFLVAQSDCFVKEFSAIVKAIVFSNEMDLLEKYNMLLAMGCRINSSVIYSQPKIANITEEMKFLSRYMGEWVSFPSLNIPIDEISELLTRILDVLLFFLDHKSKQKSFLSHPKYIELYDYYSEIMDDLQVRFSLPTDFQG